MIRMRLKLTPIHMIAEAQFTEMINQMLNVLPLADGLRPTTGHRCLEVQAELDRVPPSNSNLSRRLISR
jgi:hypothetical protein